MTGVVLCGGQSTRMGSDKGLLLHRSVPWARLAMEKLSALNIPVVLSVSSRQYPSYISLFSDAVIVHDDDALDIGGPLKGILSVHRCYPNEDLFVLACDMVNMHKDVLLQLTKERPAHASEVYLFKNDDDVIETMCGIYTAAGLKKIDKKFSEGQLKKHSMHYIANLLDAFFLPVPEAWKSCFDNFNSALRFKQPPALDYFLQPP